METAGTLNISPSQLLSLRAECLRWYNLECIEFTGFSGDLGWFKIIPLFVLLLFFFFLFYFILFYF